MTDANPNLIMEEDPSLKSAVFKYADAFKVVKESFDKLLQDEKTRHLMMTLSMNERKFWCMEVFGTDLIGTEEENKGRPSKRPCDIALTLFEQWREISHVRK